MPVGRIILKSISDSNRISKLKTDGARLLYTWLITHLDVNGCFSGDPQVIRGKVFTRLDKSNKTIEEYLIDLENQEPPLIIRYQANGDVFLNVPDFVDKQPSLNPDREGKTNIPLPTPELLQGKSRVTPTQSKLKEVKSKVSKDKYKDHVFLLKDEFDKLIKEFGKDKTNQYIENLKNYIGSKGKKYKSHYFTILNWSRKDDGSKSSSLNWDKAMEV